MIRMTPVPGHLGRSFTVREALGCGTPRATVDSAALLRPFHGIRLHRSPPRDDANPFEAAREAAIERIKALAPVLSEHAFFSGPSAALLWGLPLPGAAEETPHVGVRYPHTAPRRRGVRGRRFRPHLVSTTTVMELPVTDPATTWASLGAQLSRDDLVAVADALLWVPRDPGGYKPWLRRDPLCRPTDLRQVLQRGQWRGGEVLRATLDLARSGSASRPETLLRLLILEAGLPEPELNADIHDDFGQWLANADLVFRKRRVCVEYQGAQHRTPQAYAADLDRRHRLGEAGWVVVEVSATHLFRTPAEVVRRLRGALGA